MSKLLSQVWPELVALPAFLLEHGLMKPPGVVVEPARPSKRSKIRKTPEAKLKKMRDYYVRKRDDRLAAAKRWNAENPAKCREIHREHMRRQRKANREAKANA